MKYDLDLSKISVEKYKNILKEQYLIPSREILHENIDEKFNILKNCGFKSLLDLKYAISKSEKIDRLARETKISVEYLKILNRELGTLSIKKVALNDFLIISSDIIFNLEKNGIINTKDFYEYYYTSSNEKAISKRINISVDSIRCLISLSKLVRINGIGALAAITFYEAGYKDYNDIRNSKKEEMLEKINKVNNEKKYYKANLGLKDMQFVIDSVKMLLNFE